MTRSRAVGSLVAVLVCAVLATVLSCSGEGRKERYRASADKYFGERKYQEAVIEYRNVLQLDPGDPHAARQLGFAYFAMGDLAQAFPYLAQSRQFDPENLEVRLKLASILMLGLKTEEATREVDFVLQKNPKHFEAIQLKAALADTPEKVAGVMKMLEAVKADHDQFPKYHLIVGGLHLKSQNIPKAEESFRAAQSRDASSVEAHVALGDLLMMKKDPAGAEKEYQAAAALASPASPVQLKLTDFYLLTGRPQDAKKRLVELTEKAPDSPLASYRLAEMAFAEKQYDEVLKVLEPVFKKSPSDAEARLIRGRVYLARKETSKALEDLQEVVKVQPGAPAGHYQLALAHLQNNDREEARARLKEAVRLKPDLGDAVTALAELEIQGGAPQRAIDSLEKLLEKQPNLANALTVLGAAYMAKGDAGRAVQMYRRGMELSPKDPRIPYLLGMALRSQKKNEEAEKQFLAALKLNPKFVEPLANLVAMDFEAKKPDAALERVKRQVALDPESAALQFTLGKVHFMRKEFKEAEAAYLKGIDLDSGLSGLYMGLAQLYIADKRLDEAMSRLNDAIKANSRNVSALMLTGVLHEQQGNVSKARQAYETVLEINPRFAVAANNLAYLYAEHGGDLDKALELAVRARAEAPDDPSIADTLGWIQLKKGKIEQAVTSLQLSVSKLPDNPVVHYHLGMAYQAQGNAEAARTALRRALELNPSFPGAEEARKALERL